jgi:DNA-binding NarL/FixJ family response regulator
MLVAGLKATHDWQCHFEGKVAGGMKDPGSRKEPRRQRTDILIAHDQEIVRIGLRALLKDRPGVRVCGETRSAAETVTKVKKLQPNVLLLRLNLPDKSALEIIPELLRLRPGLKILLFAAEGPMMDTRRAVLTPTVAKRALEYGTLALVLKPDAPDIGLALDALSKNKVFISSNVFEGMASEVTHRIELLPSVSDLTRREVEIFKQLATGRTSKEIASDLGNSPRTVEAQRANIMHKLGFHSQADLILFALQHGVVESPQPAKSSQ